MIPPFERQLELRVGEQREPTRQIQVEVGQQSCAMFFLSPWYLLTICVSLLAVRPRA